MEEHPKAGRSDTRGAGRGSGIPPSEWVAVREVSVRTARWLGADDTNAEDLAQEALLRLWNHLPAVTGKVAWLRQVLRRLLLDQRARQAARGHALRQFHQQQLALSLHWDEEGASADVERILSRLSRRSRELLELYGLGYTRGEIAARLGCKSHQVGPRVSRALRTACNNATRGSHRNVLGR